MLKSVLKTISYSGVAGICIYGGLQTVNDMNNSYKNDEMKLPNEIEKRWNFIKNTCILLELDKILTISEKKIKCNDIVTELDNSDIS